MEAAVWEAGGKNALALRTLAGEDLALRQNALSIALESGGEVGDGYLMADQAGRGTGGTQFSMAARA